MQIAVSPSIAKLSVLTNFKEGFLKSTLRLKFAQLIGVTVVLESKVAVRLPLVALRMRTLLKILANLEKGVWFVYLLVGKVEVSKSLCHVLLDSKALLI